MARCVAELMKEPYSISVLRDVPLAVPLRQRGAPGCPGDAGLVLKE